MKDVGVLVNIVHLESHSQAPPLYHKGYKLIFIGQLAISIILLTCFLVFFISLIIFLIKSSLCIDNELSKSNYII